MKKQTPAKFLAGDYPPHCPKLQKYYCLGDKGTCSKTLVCDCYICEYAVYIPRLQRMRNAQTGTGIKPEEK